LNDILEALVGDAADFDKEESQLIEERWNLVGRRTLFVMTFSYLF
jgi:CBS domain containing-hemolysin-like protein